jgi:hypothetical protein
MKRIVMLIVVVAVVTLVVAAGPVLSQGQPTCEEFDSNQKACIPNCPDSAVNGKAIRTAGAQKNQCVVIPPSKFHSF